MRRAALLVVAVILVIMGNAVSTHPAEAAAFPTFPEGVRAPRGDGEFIYYLKTGNLITGDKVRVTLDGVDMKERGDGIWYLVAPQPNRRHVMHMKMWTSAESWSGWTKFKKIWR